MKGGETGVEGCNGDSGETKKILWDGNNLGGFFGVDIYTGLIRDRGIGKVWWKSGEQRLKSWPRDRLREVPKVPAS